MTDLALLRGAPSRRRSPPGPADAEAYAAGDCGARGPRPRRRGGKPRARRPGAGSACAPGSGAASATPSAPTSARRGWPRRRRAPPPAPAVADEDEFAAPPREAGEAPALGGLGDPSLRRMAGGAGRRPRAWRSSGRRWRPIPRSPGSSRPSTRIPPSGSRSPPRPASPASSSAPAATPTCRRWRTPTAGARPGSASAWRAARPASTPPRSAREGAERATAMIGAGKPASRSCPVVLDPTVAASFAALLGRALGADAVQRGRSPFAERLGEAVAGEAFVLHDDGLDPDGPASAPIDGEGVPRRRTALIEGGRLRSLPPRHLHRAARRRRLDRQRRPQRLPRAALGLGLQPDRRARLAQPRGAARGGGRGGLRHRRRRPALGRQPGDRGLLGGRLGAGRSGAASRLSRCASSRSPATSSRCCAPCAPSGAAPRWVPFGGSVSTPPLLIGEMAVGRRLSGKPQMVCAQFRARRIRLRRARNWACLVLTPSPLLDCGRPNDDWRSFE